MYNECCVSLWLCDPVDYLWKKHSLIQPGCWTEYQWQPDRREGGWRSFSYPCWLRRWLRWYCRVFPVHPRQSEKFISWYSVNQRKYWKKIIHSPSGLPPASKNTDSPRTDQMSDQSRRNWKKCLIILCCVTGARSWYFTPLQCNVNINIMRILNMICKTALYLSLK